nr:MAG TPA: hypothetical protein [Caudoviricetes sp.]
MCRLLFDAFRRPIRLQLQFCPVLEPAACRRYAPDLLRVCLFY